MQSPDNEENQPATPSSWPERVTDSAVPRPRTAGKFLAVGDAKLWVRGVTYGTFRPDARGSEYPAPDVLARDFALMAACGLNAVRTYTVPPRWLLDAAAAHGLARAGRHPLGAARRFSRRADPAVDHRRAGAGRSARCAGHPAVLGYAIGNEIPGADRPLARPAPDRSAFLRRLYEAAKSADPDGLVTYVNYPTTEYLELPFLDFVASTSTSRREARLAAYLPRLQNIAGDRPLVLAEIGLDSRRHGEAGQARALDWQVRTAFARGCAGAFVFAWTDEWHRGGHDIEDWDFGARRPRAAAQAGPRRRPARARELPLPRTRAVAAHLGRRLHLQRRAEPSRVPGGASCASSTRTSRSIVVDDGSTDDTAAIASAYGVRLIRTRQPRAQQRAQHRHRRRHRRDRRLHRRRRVSRSALADATSRTRFTTSRARGGRRPQHRRRPATARSPTASPTRRAARSTCSCPTRVAEHIPGCNMAFRRECAGGDRRLRPAVPHGRRRRRRVLAAAGARLDARLPPGADGLAPPRGTRCAPTGAAARLRPRRGAARAEVAREVQRGRAPGVGGTGLRPWAGQARGLVRRTHLPRQLGKRPLPVAVPAGVRIRWPPLSRCRSGTSSSVPSPS